MNKCSRILNLYSHKGSFLRSSPGCISKHFTRQDPARTPLATSLEQVRPSPSQITGWALNPRNPCHCHETWWQSVLFIGSHEFYAPTIKLDLWLLGYWSYTIQQNVHTYAYCVMHNHEWLMSWMISSWITINTIIFSDLLKIENL